MRAIRLGLTLCVCVATSGAAAQLATDGVWEEADVAPVAGTAASESPFVLADAGRRGTPRVNAHFDLYLTPHASAKDRAPAVILVHGADGVQAIREERYARELAAMGLHVAVLDVYRSRGRIALLDRLTRVTAMMAIADAYAVLNALDHPAIDTDRVALVGFSFGGMAAMQAALRQVAEAISPGGRRFAAHVAYYAPCLTRFEERATTGAPVVLLLGTRDDAVDVKECRRFARDLERGGSDVTITTFRAAHNWDGGTPGESERFPVSYAACKMTVDEEGMPRAPITGLPVDTVLARNTLFTFCGALGGYELRYDEGVRERSNRALAEFLNEALFN